MNHGQAFGELSVAAPTDDGEAFGEPRQGLPDQDGEASPSDASRLSGNDGQSDGEACADPPSNDGQASPSWACGCGLSTVYYARGRCKQCYESWRAGRVRAGDWWRTRGPRGAKPRGAELDPTVLAALETVEAFRREHGYYGVGADLLGWVHGREARQVLAKGLRLCQDRGLVRYELRPILAQIHGKTGVRLSAK